MHTCIHIYIDPRTYTQSNDNAILTNYETEKFITKRYIYHIKSNQHDNTERANSTHFKVSIKQINMRGFVVYWVEGKKFARGGIYERGISTRSLMKPLKSQLKGSYLTYLAHSSTKEKNKI